MNIVTRLADIERLLAEVTSSFEGQPDSDQTARTVPEGARLIDDLDQAQMLKAAAYSTPARDPAG